MAHTKKDPGYVQIFDTTLRDGEQSPGASMNVKQKLTIAHSLADMGVDIIEAGFPISSKEQFNATALIAKEIKTSVITALARAVEKDIDAAAEAVKSAAHPRIHIFLASSPLHREFKLKKSKSEILEMTREAVLYARSKCAEVEFSPEDATRTEMDFLCEVVDTAIRAGASVINIPDTVGYILPQEMYDIINNLMNSVANIDKAVISTHCHDDLGHAVANSIAAVRAGARQIEVAINGIGERAGNAALEEVVMALTVRKDALKVSTGIKTEKLYPLSKLLSTTIGFPIPRNKAVVGDNAFAHESGIHQDGVLKKRETYEIMTAQMIGRTTNNIVLGRHSGLHGLKSRLRALCLEVPEENMDALYKRFSDLADKKKEIYDEDLYALLNEVENSDSDSILYELLNVEISMASGSAPKARVTLNKPGAKDGGAVNFESGGDGPIDAIFSAIMGASGYTAVLTDFHINAVTPGTDAVGEATVELRIGDTYHMGRASSTDVLQASANAYIAAINNHIIFTKRYDAQKPIKAQG